MVYYSLNHNGAGRVAPMGLEIAKYFDTFPLVIGHRGAPKIATENSAGALRGAIDCGVDMIEVDLRTTGDGVIVLFHDKDTGRLAGVRKVVGESTLAELKRLSLKGGESIIRLEEALQIVGGAMPLNLELKSPGSGKKLAAFLRENPYEGVLIVSSFMPGELDELREKMPHIPTSALVANPSPDDIRASGRRGHLSINVNVRYLKSWMAKEAKKENIPLIVYTVDTRKTFTDLVQRGISGFFTNDPGQMVAWRDGM